MSSTALLGLAACGGGSSSAPGKGGHAELAHIHGLGINPANGELYAGTHHGVFRIPEKGEPEQVAGRTQDFMGFTILGPDHFLASGHPGPDDADSPPNLGLLKSTDGAKTWRTRSLSGEVDFHGLEAKHGQVYGYDSQTGRLMVSKDETRWDRRAQVPLDDIAVSPDDSDVVLATMQQGPARSTDGGRTFAAIDGAPLLVLLDWPSEKRLVGVAPDGAVHTSADGGKNWTKGGSVPGQPAALTTHGKAEVYVATESGIHHSTDGGKTFTLFQALE
ncbi:MAG: F510_1955 family glycosylhydrolase [Thermocrispum sp.]